MIEVSLNPSDVDDIVRTLDELMENVVANLEHFDRPVPERRYIGVGGTAWDCEQLTATVRQAYLGMPGDQAAAPVPCDTPSTVVVLIQLVRCVPSYNARDARGPSVEAMDAHARGLLRDQSALMKSMRTLDRFRGVIADSNIGEPQGEYQAVELNVVETIG